MRPPDPLEETGRSGNLTANALELPVEPGFGAAHKGSIAHGSDMVP